MVVYRLALGLNQAAGLVAFFRNPYVSIANFTFDATPVPGPLPVFGAAAAFGYSRTLRKRIAKSKAVPVFSPIV